MSDRRERTVSARDAGGGTGRDGPRTGDGAGAAISPRDTATGQVRPTGGPMERAGTEAEARARAERARGDRAG